MGQVIGQGLIHDDAVPFVNLEPDRIERLWVTTSFFIPTASPWIPMR